ncbi:MAG: Gfo/Idh/MocA family protein, partial [Isosphaeraceae bacterium]
MTDPKGSHRREFLKASTAAAAGLGFLPNVHAKGNDVIKVGLVGCGGRGTGAADNICEAAGTTYNIKIHALGDIFEDHLRNCRDAIKNSGHGRDKFDVSDERCFVGFDAYKKVIECCDLVMLATPPGFRPLHIEAVVKASKNLFTEKPVGVDPTGIRKVLAAYEEAKEKKLSVVAGTQRRHEAGYIEGIKRIHEGAIGEITSGNVYWNGGGIWAHKRRPGWSDTQYQLRNWYHFVWLCGDHIVEQHVHNLDVACWVLGHPPVRAVGMGGRQGSSEPERGQSYDHFAIDYEFPKGVHVASMCRQIDGCENNVSELFTGTKGQFHSGGFRFTGKTNARVRAHGINPYVQEHIDLLESIVTGKPINELKQVAESTLVAIMGRMSAYTGKA